MAGVLAVAAGEPARSRVMLARACDAALRGGELCSLDCGGIDPGRRMPRIGAEHAKNRLEPVVPYPAPAGVLLSGYLVRRARISRARGPLSLPEPRRHYGPPLTLRTWPKVVRRIAVTAGVPGFSTRTTRHLCLTGLARMGGERHAIAAYPGHRLTGSAFTCIRLSGRALAGTLSRSRRHIRGWRAEMPARPGEQAAGASRA